VKEYIKNNCVYPKRVWQEASPESQNIDSHKLEEALELAKGFCGGDGVRGTVIVRNGYMIWAGDEADREHDIRSCTKSITSTVFGVMNDEGLCSLITKAAEYHKELLGDYSGITLKHFATMTSGYNSVGGKYGVDNCTDGSLTPWVPREPVFSPPGTYFHYHDNAMREFGFILQKILNRPMAEYFKEKIADPIGMRRWYWTDYLGNDTGNDSASSFYTSAKEYAKLGLLYLNNGSWEGKQLLSKSWISEATRSHTINIPDYNGYFFRGISGGGSYGYNWWTNEESSFSEKPISNLPTGSYHASGFNNNHMWIIPKWNMVVVRLGVDGSVKSSKWNNFFRILSQAVK
jgi:CubicO group peptidase (beta-lactamase class C family)